MYNFCRHGDNSCANTERRMEMKRSFAYLVLALLLSLLLCACGDTTGRGNVTASPWPEVTSPVVPTPAMPTPTADFSVSPVPDFGTGNGTTNNDTASSYENGTGNNSTTGMSTSSPIPTDNDR